MTLPGGKVGQRERVLFVSMFYAVVAGVLTHYGLGPDASVSMVVVTSAAGVVASYTYKGSVAQAPAPGAA